MKPYLAVRRSLRGRWDVVEFRRASRLVELRRETKQLPLLALSSDGVVAVRGADARQQPTHEYEQRYWVVTPGDLVVNPMWLIGGGIGVSSVHGAVSPDYRVYRLNEAMHPRYVHHLLRSAPYRDQYRLLIRADTTFDRRITKDDFGGIPIPVPTVPAQRAIADYLDRETAQIDALITAKQRMMELLEERWRSVAERTMTALIAERGAIPLRYLVTCLDGRRIPVSAEERASRQGNYPYYGASGVVDWVDGWLFDEELVLLGEDGAQLGDPAYPIAQVVRGKVWVNNHAHVLRPRTVDPEFLSLHLNTFDRIEFMSGGTREKITQDDMNRIPVPRLAIEEQRRLGLQLSQVRAYSDGVVSTLTAQINLLNERRQALLTTAVTGQLDIPGAA